MKDKLLYIRFYDHFTHDDLSDEDVVKNMNDDMILEVTGFYAGEDEKYLTVITAKNKSSNDIWRIFKKAIIEKKALGEKHL